MGLRRIEDKLAKEAALREQGADYAIQELESMIENIKQLHEKLRDLEKKYKDQLKNPEISKKLMELREEIGLPQVIGAFKFKVKPGIMDKLTGGGFYEQLALQILEIGYDAIPKTGGTLSYPDLIKEIQNKYSGYVITIDELDKAIDILLKHELLVRVDKIGGLKILVFIETESPDLNEIVKLAIKHNGQLTREELIIETGWTLERIYRAVSILEEKHILEINEGVEGINYYFPGI